MADARFAKPLDEELVIRLVREHQALFMVEEGSIGGFSAQVMSMLARTGEFDAGIVFRSIYMPDKFLDHDTPLKQVSSAGLDPGSIVATVLSAMGFGKQHGRSG